MNNLKVDRNNDFNIGRGGSFEFVEGKEALSQLCVQYARASTGEMLSKKQDGMPFFQSVFDRQPSVAQFEAAFRKRMKQVPQVRSVVSFDGSINDSVLSYYAVIESDYGQVEVQDGGL
jgi:hypothetical protein